MYGVKMDEGGGGGQQGKQYADEYHNAEPVIICFLDVHDSFIPSFSELLASVFLYSNLSTARHNVGTLRSQLESESIPQAHHDVVSIRQHQHL